MIDTRDESMVLELLDDTVQRLDVFRNQVIDAEAIAHAAAQTLEAMSESSTDPSLSRVKSLATSTANNMRKLLDELTTWQTELQGHRDDDDA